MKIIPPRKTITLGGATLEYVALGSGSPTLILINGAGVPIDGWSRIFADLETMGTVFAYNRLGVGLSSKPTEAQTGDPCNRLTRRMWTRSEARKPIDREPYRHD